MGAPPDPYDAILRLLAAQRAEHRVFRHRPVLTYADAEAVRREAGFVGTEGKCLVLKVGAGFAVYTTLQGRRVDFRRIRAHLGGVRVRLATPDELRSAFGAEPGNAYPFGFGADVRVFVDPGVYGQDWLLFSPAFPTATVQVRGRDLPRVFRSLPNPTEEVTTFNAVDGSADTPSSTKAPESR